MEIALFFLLFIGVSAGPVAHEIPAADPELLNSLLKEERYDEFNYLMDINIPSLSHPREENDTNDPRFNKELERGDILFFSRNREEARQGIRFDRYPGSKWGNKIVPYSISTQFNKNEVDSLERAIRNWNARVPCIKFRRRRGESAYVLFINGNGCWANIGRTGRQQTISIAKNGCMYQNIIHHEMQHAIGISHEQNREDRDKHIRMLWHNIPESWKSQYRKNDPRYFGVQLSYDFYSNMHYPVNAPGTNKPAFDVLDRGIDKSKIGIGRSLTRTDIRKIRILYC